jgi:hypothetical protein
MLTDYTTEFEPGSSIELSLSKKYLLDLTMPTSILSARLQQLSSTIGSKWVSIARLTKPMAHLTSYRRTYRFPFLLRIDALTGFHFHFVSTHLPVFIFTSYRRHLLFIPILTTMLIPFSFNRSSFRSLQRCSFRFLLIEVHSDPYNDAHSVFF